MRHFFSSKCILLFFQIFITSLAASAADSPAPSYFPGPKLARSDSSSLGQLAVAADNTWNFVPNSTFIRSDDKYKYYQVGSTAIFRQYIHPQPVMSHADPRPIPVAPSLFWAGSFEFVSDDTAPAKPNCSESKFTFEDYMKILNDPTVQTKADFLRKIPKDSLQKFTFIHTSQSLQKQGVTLQTPRVMRFSTDGRFILTYTTNSDAYNFNGIEVMYFDDQQRKYNLAHTQFLSEAELRLRPTGNTKTNHTEQNPKACLSCHGGNDPRPNWAEYATWPGVYAENDDLLPSKDEKNYTTYGETKTTLEQYTAMRKNLAGTPELETLPWPDAKSPIYERYPYLKFEKEMNYNLRPNAHMTIASSRLNAQRLARKFEENLIYPKIKWSLLHKALQCYDSEKKNPLLEKILSDNPHPNLPRDESWRATYDYDILRRNPFYQIGFAMGLVDTDWNLSFTEKPSKTFRDYHTAQWSMADFTASVLFRNLTVDDPRLKPYDVRINRMSNLFGKNFMCLDEVADRLWFSEKRFVEVCKIIEDNISSEANALTTTDFEKVKQIKNDVWDERQIETKIKIPSPVLGKKIISTTCASCHSDNVIPFNFKTLSEFSKTTPAAAKKAYTAHIEKKLGTSTDCEMPKPIAGACLNDVERKSVLMFLNSL